MKLELALTNWLTEWDVKQSSKRGYNPYALSQYFAAAEECCNWLNTNRECCIADGIKMHFTDRLQAFLLKKIANTGPWSY